MIGLAEAKESFSRISRKMPIGRKSMQSGQFATGLSVWWAQWRAKSATLDGLESWSREEILAFLRGHTGS
jgi:hypothetical protein